MTLNLKSINFDAGMKHASGIIAIELAGAPVDLEFNGTLTILGGAPVAAAAPPIAATPIQPKNARKQPKQPTSSAKPAGGMTWPQAIIAALQGGNLTKNELLDHTMRLRGVVIKDSSYRKAEMQRLIVATSTAKKEGLIERIEENGIDKWKLVTTKKEAIA